MAQACDRCHRATEPEWIAWSDYAKAYLCYRCHGDLPPVDKKIIGLNLNIPPCAKCGEPLGERYKSDGKRVCWPCVGVTEPKSRSPKPTPYAAFQRKVFTNWKRRDAGVLPVGDGQGHISGYCPACRVVVIVAQVVDIDTGPELAIDGCENGCTPSQIAKVLLT